MVQRSRHKSKRAPAQRFEPTFWNTLTEMVRCCNVAHASSVAHAGRFEKDRERMGQVSRNAVTHRIPAEHQRRMQRYCGRGDQRALHAAHFHKGVGIGALHRFQKVLVRRGRAVFLNSS
jgi:hypothetical protein